MDKDYSLRLSAPYGGDGNFAHILDRLPGVRESWERTENRWGFFEGVFSVEGNGVSLEQLMQFHGQWLGYEAREVIGDVMWEGYVHELRLYHQEICRVYGYDVGGDNSLARPGMYNAVRVGVSNLVDNAEFEEDGTGGQAFAAWTQVVASGDSISKELTDPIKGGQSPKLTNGGSGDTRISQSVAVIPSTTYRIRFVSCGDGSVAGRYRVRDGVGGGDIIPLTSTDNTGLDQFRGVTEEIVTPSGCDMIAFSLYAPATAGFAVFDSVYIQPILDGDQAEAYTDWATNEQSIERHGRREITLSPGDIGPGEAERMRDSFLLARAWPQEQQTGGDGSTRLEVYCLGYIHRADWLYTDDMVAARDTLSGHVAAIAAKLPWVTSTAVRSNAASFTLAETPQTYLEALKALVESGDADGNMWRVFIDRGRRLVYEQVEFTPALSMAGGRLYERLGDKQSANGRLLRAMKVVRNFDFPDRTRLPGSLLLQRNDSLMESVTVGPSGLRRQWAGL